MYTYILYMHDIYIYLNTYVRTYIHPYLPLSLRPSNPSIHLCIHPSIHPHVRTYIRRYAHAYVHTWKAKCPIFKAIVAGFRGKVAPKNRTLGVPGTYLHTYLHTQDLHICISTYLHTSITYHTIPYHTIAYHTPYHTCIQIWWLRLRLWLQSNSYKGMNAWNPSCIGWFLSWKVIGCFPGGCQILWQTNIAGWGFSIIYRCVSYRKGVLDIFVRA